MAITKQEFLKSIRTKYPSYAWTDDEELYSAIITKYPEYKTQISDVTEVTPEVWPQPQVTQPQEIEVEEKKPWLLSGIAALWSSFLRETWAEERAETAKQAVEAVKATPWAIVWAVKEVPEEISKWTYRLWADISKITRWELEREWWIEKWLVWRAAERVGEVWQDILAAKTAEVMWEQTPWESFAQAMWITALALSDTVWDIFISTLKTAAPEEVEETVKESLKAAIESKWWQAVMSEVNEAIAGYEYLKETDPWKARNYKAFFWWLQAAADLAWLWVTKQTIKPVKQLIKGLKKAPIKPWIAKTTKEIVTEIPTKEFIWPFKPKKETVITWMKKRIAEWPKEFKWVVWKEPVITPVAPVKPKIVKWVDITKSDDLIARGLKPTVAWKDTWPKLARYNNKIREWIETTTKRQWVATDWPDALHKVDAAKKEVWKTVEDNQDYVKTITKWDEIVNKINDFKKSRDWEILMDSFPNLEKKLKQYVETFSKEGKQYTQKELLTLKTNQNKKIPANKWAELMTSDKDQLLADSEVARILWDILDTNVEKVLGKTNKSLMKEYGSLRTLEKDLARRMWVFQRNTKGWLAWLTDIFNLPDMIIWGMTWDIKQLWRWVIWKAIVWLKQRAENPNVIIKELFKIHSPKKATLGKKVQTITWLEDVEFKWVPKKTTKTTGLKKKVEAETPTKAINTKAWYIDPWAFADDMAKLWKKIVDPKEYDAIAKSVVSKVSVAKNKLWEATKIVKEYIKKYWTELKDKLWDLFDELADKVWARTKLLGWKWAKEAPLSNLEIAENMTKSGKSADDVWKKTGWEKGKDWEWKFEIDDAPAVIKKSQIGNAKKVSDVLDHPELYKQYPEIKDIDIEYRNISWLNWYFDPIENKIVINWNLWLKLDTVKWSKEIAQAALDRKTPYWLRWLDRPEWLKDVLSKKAALSKWKTPDWLKDLWDTKWKSLFTSDKQKSTLLHELQHAIQTKEWFAKWTNVEWLIKWELKVYNKILNKIDDKLKTTKDWKQLLTTRKDVKKIINNLEKEWTEKYKITAWEVEARGVQKRLWMTTAEKKWLRPAKTEDIPRSKQTLRRK